MDRNPHAPDLATYIAKARDNDAKIWTEQELLAECERLAALFPPKTWINFIIGMKYGNPIGGSIWIADDANRHCLVYGTSFTETIAAIEAFAETYALNNRVMTADDLGLQRIIAEEGAA